ncbi:hypothetical protein B0H12DRAFT_523814 [Mycena haematopus]|nr:hypothetical protein B0H12DRAFT_523814 [Mycena haematopus]
MSLPELRSFYLEEAYNVDLMRLIPSPQSLRYLRLEVEGLGCENLLASLAEMPVLEELILFAEPRSKEQTDEPNIWRYWKSDAGDKEFLAHLTPSSEDRDSTLCPLLRRVNLRLCLTSDESLLQFVQSRTGHGGILASVTVTFPRPMQLDIIPHLQDSIADGLVVALDYQADIREAPTYSLLEGNTNPALCMIPQYMFPLRAPLSDPEFD